MMRERRILTLWLPLAVSFELMMLEGPAVQAAIGRLPHSTINLAAWGLTLSLSLIVESPVIMLLATSIALVKNPDTYFALRRFMLALCAFCTVVTAVVAFTPLFDAIAGGLMGYPKPIVDAARPAMRVMLLWSAAIGWRRFYQGVLVGFGHTPKVTWGTATRLTAAVTTAALLVHFSHLSGVVVGSIALMVAVLTEASATTMFSLPVVQRQVAHVKLITARLSQVGILKFHAPLAATTLLTLLAQPMTASALARLPHPVANLAVLPVASMLILVMRGWGLALQEVTVAAMAQPDLREGLHRFTWSVGLCAMAATLVVAASPLEHLYFHKLLHLPVGLEPAAHVGLLAGSALPLLAAAGSWARGMLVAQRGTSTVYAGMGLNLATNAAALYVGVQLKVPGMVLAFAALSLASAVEYLYLVWRLRLLASLAVYSVENGDDRPRCSGEPAAD